MRLGGRGLAALAAVVAVGSALSVSGTATALDACAGNWKPVLRDYTVNQGLGNYSPLVRGKTTLVRLFLSEPTCAPDGTVQLTGATINAFDNGTQIVNNVPTTSVAAGTAYPTFDSYLNAPTTNGPANPIFKLPNFAQNGTAASTVTFTVTVNWQYRTSTSVTTWTPGTAVTFSTSGVPATNIQAKVAPAANPMRVLVVPMGDASKPMSSQFPEARNGGTPVNGQYADTAVQKGIAAMARLMPVADGPSGTLATDLTSPTGGLRWRLDDAAMIDLGSSTPDGLRLLQSPQTPVPGSYCGTGPNFSSQDPALKPSTVSAKLSAFLNNWNTNNPTAQADRVVGAVWQQNSVGSAQGCADGLAVIPNTPQSDGREAYVRVFADQTVTNTGTNPTTTSPDTSETGGLLGMEVTHTFGFVTLADSRDSGQNYHSANVSADPNNTHRAYNISLGQWLASPMSTMHYSGDSTGYTTPTNPPSSVSSWNNDNTVLEQPDYLATQCELTPGIDPSNNLCPSNTASPTSGVSAAGAEFAVDGTTDGTVDGTDLHSYFTSNAQISRPDPVSQYLLIQRNGTVRIPTADFKLPASLVDSDHDGASNPAEQVNNVSIGAVVAADANATAFEVWRGDPNTGGTMLYRRTIGTPPVITTTSGSSSIAGLQDFTNGPGDEVTPAISPDGGLIAWGTSAGIVVQRRNPATNLPAGPTSAPLAGLEPAWSPAGSTIAFATASGDIDTATVTVASGAPTFGQPQTIYNHLLQTPPPLGSTAASHPSYSPSGGSLAAAVNGGIWGMSATSGANPVVCNLSTLVPTSTCSNFAADGTDARPSWGSRGGSADGLVAYERGTDIYTLDPNQSGAGFDRTLRIRTASRPAWGAGLLAYAQGGSIWVADSSSVASDKTYMRLTQLTSPPAGSVDTAPALSAGAGAVAFDRLVSAANGHDVMDATLTSTSPTISFSATTTGDPHLLRADVYVGCASSYEPIFGAVKPVNVSGNRADFSMPYEEAKACPGATVYGRVTDGWNITDRTPIRTIPGSPSDPPGAPGAAIAFPSPGTVYLQYDAVLAGGSSVDAQAGTNGSGNTLQWTLTGPSGSGYSATPVGSTSQIELDPKAPTGWAPGTYTLRLTVTNPYGQSSVTSTTFRVLADPNHSGGNVSVTFGPQTLYVPSNGNDVTLTVKAQGQNLANVIPSTVKVTQVGNTPTDIAVDTASGTNGWVANGDGTYTAKVNRQTLTCAIAKTYQVGTYVPIVISGSGNGVSFSGFDPANPTTSPATNPTSC